MHEIDRRAALTTLVALPLMARSVARAGGGVHASAMSTQHPAPVPATPSAPAPRTNRTLTPIARGGAVAADHESASRAGVEVLRLGGNAVDAAVATSFALSVVRPYSCGIGGGGFMVIALREDPRRPGSGPVRVAINYRDMAPAWATPDAFANEQDADAPARGGKSVLIPGTVAGLLHALERYGTLDRAAVLAPAIRLAEEGFVVDAHYVQSVREDVLPFFQRRPDSRERFPFLWSRFLREGKVDVGDRVVLPEQARALRLIAPHGVDGFYRGPVAEAIVRAANRDGGPLTMADMASFKVVEQAPLVTTFEGRTVLGMPPPSSGGLAIAQALGVFERVRAARGAELSGWSATDPRYVHLLTEAMTHAFADRARWLGDPAFVDVPVERLLSRQYLDDLASRVDMRHDTPLSKYGSTPADWPGDPVPEDGGTSHLSVVDTWGNAVACTETINLIFGSFVGVDEFGFILGDLMDDFLTRPGVPNEFGLVQSPRNLPAPGKRPLSSMSPMIVLEGSESGGGNEQRVALVAGGSGGPRIISGTLLSALNCLLFDMSAAEALASPRFHHQWLPDVLQMEKALLESPAAAELRTRGHDVKLRALIGTVQLIRGVPAGADPKAGGSHAWAWQAASDPRKGGVAVEE
jgi:gamma-glutamyltranspeptidase/glutathione hydrolase